MIIRKRVQSSPGLRRGTCYRASGQAEDPCFYSELIPDICDGKANIPTFEEHTCNFFKEFSVIRYKEPVCFPLVAWAVAVADAHPQVLRQADFILTRKGGHGAVREICDIVLRQYGFRASV